MAIHIAVAWQSVASVGMWLHDAAALRAERWRARWRG
jgi:hypothetical protein